MNFSQKNWSTQHDQISSELFLLEIEQVKAEKELKDLSKSGKITTQMQQLYNFNQTLIEEIKEKLKEINREEGVRRKEIIDNLRYKNLKRAAEFVRDLVSNQEVNINIPILNIISNEELGKITSYEEYHVEGVGKFVSKKYSINIISSDESVISTLTGTDETTLSIYKKLITEVEKKVLPKKKKNEIIIKKKEIRRIKRLSRPSSILRLLFILSITTLISFIIFIIL